MLSAYPSSSSSLSNATWIDLVEPTEDEKSSFEQAFGLRVPAKEELAEIESSSRLQIEKDALYLTSPLIHAAENQPWILSPVGFVLSKQILMTVRYTKFVTFGAVIKELGPAEKLEPASAFARILEEFVDRLADLLESSSSDLDEASHAIFRQQDARRLSHQAALLRRLLIRTGRTSERMARTHYALVCLDRMAKFTGDRARDWIGHEVSVRLQAVSSDIASLIQFAEGLVSRVQLLQDAAAGIINIDQNDVMKVLTIASVVGIPPVLVAGIYGMNFPNMPELHWSWGYPYALAAIVITALVPLLWFKWKDWI
jgi:magnesium transporter